MRLRTILLLVLGLLLVVPVVFVLGLWWIDRDFYRDLIVRQVEQATGRRFVLGELGFEPGLRPTLVASRASLANASWAKGPDMLQLDRLELQLDLPSLLTGRPEIERLVLVRPVLRLERGPNGAANWQFQPPERPAAPPDPQEPAAPASAGWLPAIGRLAIEDGLFTYRADPQAPELRLALPQAALSAPDPARPASLDLTGALNDVPLAAKGAIGPLPALMTGAPTRLDLEASLAAVAVKLAGMAGRSFDLHAELAAPELAGLTPALAPFGVPAGRLAALAPAMLKAHAAGDAGRVAVDDLAMAVAGSDLAGTVTAALDGTRPRLEAKLHGRLVDLRSLLAADGAGDEPRGPSREDPLFSDAPLPLDGLRRVDGRIELDLDELRAKTLAAHDLHLVAALENGRLRVEPIAAALPGGGVTGSAALDASGGEPALELAAAGRNLALGELIAALAPVSWLEATADFDVHLQSQGASPKALAEQLEGRVALLTGEGGLRVELLDRVAQGLRQGLGTALGLSGDIVPLRCLALDTPVRRGVAEPDLVATTPVAIVIGTGSVDLGRDRLDLVLTPRANLAGLQVGVPVTLAGPLRQPEVGLDPAGAVRDLTGALKSFFPQEIMGGADMVARRRGNPCLDPAAGGGSPVDAIKALGGTKEELEKVGKGLLQNLLKGR